MAMTTAPTQRRVWKDRLGGTGTRPQVGDLYIREPREQVIDQDTGDCVGELRAANRPVLAEVVSVGAPVSGWWVELREVPEPNARGYLYLERGGRLGSAVLLLEGARAVLVDRRGQPLQAGAVLSVLIPRDATDTERELLRQAINLPGRFASSTSS
jgi:hypothetical protein